MTSLHQRAVLALVIVLITPSSITDPPVRPIKEPYNYAPAMASVARRFRGVSGVFLHFGDSNTYAEANTACARTPAVSYRSVETFLKWSHRGERNALDGWWLASVDIPQRSRSETAATGLRANELLVGGKEGLPPLSDLIARYNPQLAVYMLGTNDAKDGRPVDEYIIDVEKALDTLMANGTVPILSTLPPLRDREALIDSYSNALRALAARLQLPLIDLSAEMLERGGDRAAALFVGSDGIHLSVGAASGPDTIENLKSSGYLLRCQLTLVKAMEVKAAVLDRL